MKKLVFIMAVFVIFLGCTQGNSQKGAEKKNPELGAKEKTAALEEDLNTLDKEKIELLAFKYSVPKEEVRGVIKDYLQRHDPLYRDSDANDFQETFAVLEKKYKMKPEKLGAILIDYKVMREAETGD